MQNGLLSSKDIFKTNDFCEISRNNPRVWCSFPIVPTVLAEDVISTWVTFNHVHAPTHPRIFFSNSVTMKTPTCTNHLRLWSRFNRHTEEFLITLVRKRNCYFQLPPPQIRPVPHTIEIKKTKQFSFLVNILPGYEWVELFVAHVVVFCPSFDLLRDTTTGMTTTPDTAMNFYCHLSHVFSLIAIGEL